MPALWSGADAAFSGSGERAAVERLSDCRGIASARNLAAIDTDGVRYMLAGADAGFYRTRKSV